MERIAYLGAFGVGNRGDDYLAYAFAQDHPASLYVGFAPPHFDALTPFLTFEQLAGQSVFDFDVVTVCGGNFIWSVDQLRSILAIARAVTAGGKRLTIRSVHVAKETVWEDPDSFIALASLAAEFTVRDHNSVGLCGDFGITVKYERDILGQFIEKYYPRVTPIVSAPFRIGFNFHHHGEASVDWYFDYLATINHFSTRPLNLLYVLQCRHLTHWQSNEALIAEVLYTRFGGRMAISPVDQSLVELVASFQNLDLMISNRTHGIIIANALGVRTIPSGIIDEKSHAQARDLGLPIVSLKEHPHAAGARVAKLLNCL